VVFRKLQSIENEGILSLLWLENITDLVFGVAMSVLFPEGEKHSDEVEVGGLPVDPGVAFTNKKNVYKKRIEKRQRKLLGYVSFLRPFLEVEEKVLLCTTGCSPMSALEQFFTGYLVYYLKKSMFVFTDRRIFHIPTTSDHKHRNSLAQIRYSDCKLVKARGHVLTVKYNKGKAEKLYRIASKEQAKLRVLTKSFQLGDGESRRTFLCPNCGALLVADLYRCEECPQLFKTKKEAWKQSWIYPGGGYFYTGHPILGAFDALTEIFLIFGIIMSVVGLVKGESLGAELLYLIFALILEKLLTVFHSIAYVEEYIAEGTPELTQKN